jgi:hypothetical protein
MTGRFERIILMFIALWIRTELIQCPDKGTTELLLTLRNLIDKHMEDMK